MADPVSAPITIGGNLSAALLLDLVRIVGDEGLSADWDGSDFFGIRPSGRRAAQADGA